MDESPRMSQIDEMNKIDYYVCCESICILATAITVVIVAAGFSLFT